MKVVRRRFNAALSTVAHLTVLPAMVLLTGACADGSRPAPDPSAAKAPRVPPVSLLSRQDR